MKTSYARFFLITIAIVQVLVLAACTSSPYRYTKIVDVTQNTEAPAQPPYHAPVVGVLVDSPARATLENAVVAALRARGVNARAALPIYGNKGIADKSRSYLADQLRAHDFDSAIGIHLVHKGIDKIDVDNGASVATPTAAAPTLRAEPLGPGFTLEEQTYVAKVNFWDIDQEAIVWSATSVTHNPKGLDAGAKQFAKTVVSQLMKAGLFAASSPQ